jgi:hypothetical protein
MKKKPVNEFPLLSGHFFVLLKTALVLSFAERGGTALGCAG